jgi:hypothetical protein
MNPDRRSRIGWKERKSRPRGCLLVDSNVEPRVGAARKLIAIRCLATSHDFAESDVGTIYKTSAFEIAPATRQRTREAALKLERLEPWTGGVHLGAGSVVRSSSAFTSMN